MKHHQVIVFREGFSSSSNGNLFSAACTISLVVGEKNILFDPGSPWDEDLIDAILAKKNLRPSDIDYVVCSHGHVDHVGNLNKFTTATIFVGTDVMRNGQFIKHDFSEDNPYVIDENVKVISTPGHTNHDVSLVVENVPDLGTVVISGDIFENELDRQNPNLWRDNSLLPDSQEKSRNRILSIADYIIPGHGGMFKV